MAELKAQLAPVIDNALSLDRNTRIKAEAQLQQAEGYRFVDFCRALAFLLADNSTPAASRTLAGLQLKNALSGSKPESKFDRDKRQRWIAVDSQTQREIRAAVFSSLTSGDLTVCRAASQAISKMMRTEMSRQFCPDLEQALAALHEAGGSGAESCYTLIEFLLEDTWLLQTDEVEQGIKDDYDGIRPEYHQSIVPLIMAGSKSEVPATRVAALRAYAQTLKFLDDVGVESKRAELLEPVISAIQPGCDTEVQIAGWSCVYQVASDFYPVLNTIMATLAPLSLYAIRSEEESVAMAGIEFWSCVAELEAIIKEEKSETYHQFLIQANETLIPAVLARLVKESLDEDVAGWGIDMAAGACLCLCAQVSKDVIVDTVIKFVEANFGSGNPALREAAVMAYGSILRGPSPERLAPIVAQSIDSLVLNLKDSVTIVRESTAWCLSRICENIPEAVMDKLGDRNNKGMISILVERLEDAPKVAAFACYALNCIAGHCFQTGRKELDQFFEILAPAILRAGNRDNDISRQILTDPAYECLSKVIYATTDDCKGMKIYLHELLAELAILLEQSVTVPPTTEVTRIQTFVTGCAQVVLQRFLHSTEASRSELEPELVKRLLVTFTIIASSVSREGDDEPGEEVVMAKMAIESVLPSVSFPLEDSLICKIQDICRSGLKEPQNQNICKGSLGLASAITEYIMKTGPSETTMRVIVAPLFEDMFKLLETSTKEVSLTLKTNTLTTLGDMSMYCGHPYLLPYINQIVSYLFSAGKVTQTKNPTPDWIDYVLELRHALCVAYAGLLYGAQTPNQREVSEQEIRDGLSKNVAPLVHQILEFLADLLADPHMTLDVVQQAAGIVGDLIEAFKAPLLLHIAEKFPNMLQSIAVRMGSEPPDSQAGMIMKWIDQMTDKYR